MKRRPTIIVGVSGKRHHGKDTFASVFALEFGFQRVAFADPLKWWLERQYGIDHQALFGPSAKRDEPFRRPFRPSLKMIEAMLDEIDRIHELDPELRERLRQRLGERAFLTARALLDHLGTDVCRQEIDDRFIIEAATSQFARERVILPDVRTPLERKILRQEWEATLVFVERLGHMQEEHGHVTHQQLGQREEYDYFFQSMSVQENKQHARDLAKLLVERR